MKQDITTRHDIELLVNSFYEKVKRDKSIGYIFTDIARVNWETHLPVMYDFFENMLFYTGSYAGNPMQLHNHINRLLPLTKEHFKKWEALFCNSVDELFEGEKATLVKQRAINISTVMQKKIINAAPADKIF